MIQPVIWTEIRTTSDIGSSNPDNIRDYIRNEYLNNGINYVILGADDGMLPAKDLYVMLENDSWLDGSKDTLYEYNMPGDIYYACLDGSWNSDGDDLWGEPDDGEGGGEVDLIAEVYVGRIAADTPEEVQNMVNKSIRYMEERHPYLYNIILAGEYLGFEGDGEFAGYSLEQFIDSSSEHGYSTIGFPTTTGFRIEKMYDLERTWSKWDMI